MESVDRGKAADLLLTAAGMAAFMGGRKIAGLGLFARGVAGIERRWQARHPEVGDSLRARWDEAVRFYEQTHQHPVNRKLHIVGIPLILGGAGGLLFFPAYRPLWAVSAASFGVGWVLNIVGHAVFEKNAPAFADDPLSFLAGPVWDAQQLMGGAVRAVRE